MPQPADADEPLSTEASRSAAPRPTVPEGFGPMPSLGPYFQPLEPVYMRDGAPEQPVFGLHVTSAHENMQGLAHGGMLATLVDGAVGYSIARARGVRLSQVTVSMTIDYLSSARPGEWLEAHVRINRMGRRMAFADCNLHAGGRHVVRASAVFAFVERAGPDGAPPG